MSAPRDVRPSLNEATTSPAPTTSSAPPRTTVASRSQPVKRPTSARAPAGEAAARGGGADPEQRGGGGDPGGGGARPGRRPGTRRLHAVRGVGRHEQPQQEVDQDAGAAGEREGDEADPPQERVDAA